MRWQVLGLLEIKKHIFMYRNRHFVGLQLYAQFFIHQNPDGQMPEW